MAMKDNEFILESAHNLERWENTPRAQVDDFADMSTEEKSKLIVHLFELLGQAREESLRNKAEQEKRDAEKDKVVSGLYEKISALTERVSDLVRLLKESNENVASLTRRLEQSKEENSKLSSLVKMGKKRSFGSLSQKRKKTDGNDDDTPVAHADAKEGFDGTAESLPRNLDVDCVDTGEGEEDVDNVKESRINRLGMSYQTMEAGNYVSHNSDLSKLPEGSTIMKFSTRYSYDQVTTVTEHRYQIVVFKDKKALTYLDTFWKQVFRYRNDGEYTIGNTLAERFIRPLANKRKNSLFYGSHRMARVYAAYHSIVSTCIYQGYSVLEYLKKFFKEIVAGNRDYKNLLPNTIGISVNKF